jgi:nicotinate dehydrogenase subunit A
MTLGIELDVNTLPVTVDVDPQVPLLQVLRNDLGLTGTKFGCGLEQCFACAVLVDGVEVASCTAPVEGFVGRKVRTIEGLAEGDRLHPVQQAFLDEQAAQCGYCIPGMIVGAVALLDRTPNPTDDEIREALERHLCRCGTHGRILKAVRRAADLMAARDLA